MIHLVKTKNNRFRSKATCFYFSATVSLLNYLHLEAYTVYCYVHIDACHHYYFGSLIDNKLKFVANAEMIGKRAQRLYCLHKLLKFHVDQTLMSLFYKSYFEYILKCSIVCRYSNLSVKVKNALSIIVKANSILSLIIPCTLRFYLLVCGLDFLK